MQHKSVFVGLTVKITRVLGRETPVGQCYSSHRESHDHPEHATLHYIHYIHMGLHTHADNSHM